MGYRREIDGLRALALLPVMLFHAGFETFGGGFVGVDVFFVISGYLITNIILVELEQGRFSIVNFYERRARRILPALFLVMLVCIPFAWLWLLPLDMKDFSRSLVAVSVFASNILFWRGSGYFDTAAEHKPLLHTWSLAVEEQYYVLFPLFLMLIWRLGRRWVLVSLSLICAISLTLAQYGAYAAPAAAFFLLPTRGWELLIGAFAAIHLSAPNRAGFSKRLSETGGWLGLVLILLAVFAYSKATPFPSLYALAPTVGTVLVILFATQRTMVGRFVGNQAFVGLGLISYSAYLWHQPLFAFYRHMALAEKNQFAFCFLSVLALVLAFLSWRYVERPFRTKGKFSRGQVSIFAVSGSVFFIAFGYIGYKSDGFEFRWERVLSGDVGQFEFYQYMRQKYFDCEPKSVSEQALIWNGFLRCKQSKAGSPDVVLLGDSHAEHLFLGIAEYKSDRNIAYYILGGKPYIGNPEFKTIFREILRNNQLQHIVLTMHFVERFGIGESDLYEGFSATIKALKDAGKTVSLVGDVPKFPRDPGYCVYDFASQKASSMCQISNEEVEKQRRTYRSTLQRLSSENDVLYVDIDHPLCTEDNCSMTSGEFVLYRDNNHLNIIGSKLVGKYLADKLRF